MTDTNKFFHPGIANRISKEQSTKVNTYTDQRIEEVYVDLKEVAGKLDARFQEVDDSVTSLDIAFSKEIFDVNTYLKGTRNMVRRHLLMHIAQAFISASLIIALLLLSGCSGGIKTVFNNGYPSAVVDRATKAPCKRVISTVEAHRRVDVFGKPCQVSLVYE